MATDRPVPGPATPPSPPLLPVAAGRAGIRLRCLREFRAGEASVLRAFCRGVEVGRRALPARLTAGAEFDLPIERLPRTELPAELRFAADPEGEDLAAPWPLPNAGAAVALLGAAAAPEVTELRLDQGVLHGLATERANGLLEPVMYARINESGARGVRTEPPWPLPEGGCAFRFSVPLEPGDLNETGLAVALHLVGVEAPVARFAYARVGLEGPSPRLAALEARIERLERQAGETARALAEEQRRQAALVAERADAFIETAAALLLDRVAGTASRPASGEDPRLAALRGLIAEAAAAPPEAAPLLLGRRAEIPPAAGHLATGWHPPEQDAAGPFRWMAEAALVVNPEPHRRVAQVTIAVRHLYGAPEPRLAADFDGLPAGVAVARAAAAAGGFLVTLTPAGGEPVPCRALRLAALHGGVPLRDGRNPDPRHLSIAVGRIAFDYAPEPPAPAP